LSSASSTSSSSSSSVLIPYINLVLSVEQLLSKLDDALLEARLAREAMLLYVQV